MRYVKKCLQCGYIGVDSKKRHWEPNCSGEVVELDITYTEYCIINAIEDDPEFFDDMVTLKKKKPNEYQEKIDTYSEQIASGIHQQSRTKMMNQCPYCKSRKISRIGGNRVAKLISVGIFSKKARVKWRCHNCGGQW
jgi:hypothetical protein